MLQILTQVPQSITAVAVAVKAVDFRGRQGVELLEQQALHLKQMLQLQPLILAEDQEG